MKKIVLLFILALSTLSSCSQEKIAQSDIKRLERNVLLGYKDYGIEYQTKAIAEDPKNSKNYSIRASGYIHINEFSAAIMDFDMVKELCNDCVNANIGRGICEVYLEDYNRAISDFDEVFKIMKVKTITKLVYSPLQAYTYRGFSKLKLNDFQAAYEDSNNAIKEMSIDKDYKQIRHEGEEYKNVLKPEVDQLAYYVRGVALYNLGKKDEACRDLKKAAELGYNEANRLIEKYCN